jgi:zinc transport system substrate-binding protein
MRRRHFLSATVTAATLRATAAGAAVLLTAGGLAACGMNAPAASGKLAVVASFYPLQFVAGRIGGDAVSITNLTAPGAEPHDLELTPQQVAQIAQAKVVIYLKGLQPAVDKAVESQAKGAVIDVSTLVSMLTASDKEAAQAPGLRGRDPHVWLDPARLSTIATAVAAKLGEVDSAHQADFTGSSAKLAADLAELDMEYATSLKTCQRKEIFTSHAAFGYLAQRYHLTQISLSRLDPEAEPTPQDLAKVADEARRYHATTIFYETLVSPKVSQTIAKEVGATAAVLDPIEGLRPGSTGDYLSIMRNNLKALRTALGCS